MADPKVPDLLSAYKAWTARGTDAANLRAIRQDLDRLTAQVQRWGETSAVLKGAKASEKDARRAAKAAARATPSVREARALHKATRSMLKAVERGETGSAVVDRGWITYRLQGGKLERSGFERKLRP